MLSQAAALISSYFPSACSFYDPAAFGYERGIGRPERHPNSQPRTAWIVVEDHQYEPYLSDTIETVRSLIESKCSLSVRVGAPRELEGNHHTEDLLIYVTVATSRRPDISPRLFSQKFTTFTNCILMVIFKSSSTRGFSRSFAVPGMRSGLNIRDKGEIAREDGEQGWGNVAAGIYRECFMQIVTNYTTGVPLDDDVNKHYWSQFDYTLRALEENTRCQCEQ